MNSRTLVDWVGIETEYRAGIRSIRAIADQFNVSDTAIRKKAKREDWVRDLKGKIEAETERMVRNQVVRDQVRADVDANISESDVIKINAQARTDIIFSHQRDIVKHKSLRDKLLAECTAASDNNDDLINIAEILAEENSDIERMQTAFRKAMSLPSRVDTFKKLVDSTKTLVGLEREAFGLSDNSNGDSNQPVTEVKITYV